MCKRLFAFMIGRKQFVYLTDGYHGHSNSIECMQLVQLTKNQIKAFNQERPSQSNVRQLPLDLGDSRDKFQLNDFLNTEIFYGPDLYPTKHFVIFSDKLGHW